MVKAGNRVSYVMKFIYSSAMFGRKDFVYKGWRDMKSAGFSSPFFCRLPKSRTVAVSTSTYLCELGASNMDLHI